MCSSSGRPDSGSLWPSRGIEGRGKESEQDLHKICTIFLEGGEHRDFPPLRLIPLLRISYM